MFTSNLQFDGQLDAVLVKADGTRHDCGTVATSTIPFSEAVKKVKDSKGFWSRLWLTAKQYNLIPVGLGLAGFTHAMLTHDTTLLPHLALVTTAGVNYLALDFISGGSAHISAFSYVDCGTGTTAASVSDTALQTAAGTSRVSGTQSTPSSGQYRVVATIPFTSTLAITEMGIFSAATVGTLFDRRVFSAINVSSGDSISFQYTISVTAGGS